jgi:translation initiation factor IF-3
LRPRRRFEPVRPVVPQARINEGIRVPNVRLIDEKGEQVGIKPTAEAMEYAFSKNLDLVEVAEQADPPVCKVMDYGKYRYAEEQKAKLARKHQTQIHIKEIKLRPKIGIHDFETKKGHVVRFLNQRAKVKVTIMFRGRETTHPERGRDLLLRLAEDVKEIGQIESQPLLDGRNMVMVLGPTKAAGLKADEALAEDAEAAPEADGAVAVAAPETAAPEAAEPEAAVTEEAVTEAAPAAAEEQEAPQETKTEAKAAPKPKAAKTEAKAAAEPQAESEGS